MRIFFTGTGGRLARVLLPRLLANPAVRSIVGIDLQRAQIEHPKLEQHRRDIRDPKLGALMEGCDSLIHAGFVVIGAHLGHQRRRRTWVHDVNVAGSQNVFRQAADSGLTRLVHLSSVAVYSGLPESDHPISEYRPLLPLTGFAYAEDKVAVEHWLDGFERDHPEVGLVRLRPHVILGLYAQPLLLQLLSQPICPRTPNGRGQIQCVAELDVARAVELAVFGAATGAFNIAAGPPLNLEQILRLRGIRPVPVPVWSIRLSHRLGWWLTTRVGDPGWARGLGKTLTVDCSKAAGELGWQPQLSVYDCVRMLPPPRRWRGSGSSS